MLINYKYKRKYNILFEKLLLCMLLNVCVEVGIIDSKMFLLYIYIRSVFNIIFLKFIFRVFFKRSEEFFIVKGGFREVNRFIIIFLFYRF